MIYILVSNKGSVIGKEVYCGDDAQSAALVAKKALVDPSLTYTTTDQGTFDSTSVNPVASKDQTDWQAAKSGTAVQAITFLAKKLGLE